MLTPMTNHFAPKSNAARDVLEQVRITGVWSALGGGELRHGRGRAFWRGGDGLNVVLDDAKGTWYDHVAGEGGGILDLVRRVRGGTRADSLRFCASVAGIALDDSLSEADRARWAAARRELECELPNAVLWRRAAVGMAEEVLGGLKTALMDRTLPEAAIGEIGDVYSVIQRFRKADGAGLVTEYLWWREHRPGLTGGMLRAAKSRKQVEGRAVAAYLRDSNPKRRA